MNIEQLQEIIDGLYIICEDCEGSGKDSYYKSDKYPPPCYRCSGEGKTVSEFGQQLMKFIQDNIKIRIST